MVETAGRARRRVVVFILASLAVLGPLASAWACVVAGQVTITTNASPGGLVGRSVFDRALISLSTGGPPAGTVTFRLYGPNDADCSRPPVFTSSDSLTTYGDAAYAQSDAFTPAAPGTYLWAATYNSPTSQYPADCGTPANNAVITAAGGAQPTITGTASPAKAAGLIWPDEAATLAGGNNPAGEIHLVLYGPNDPTCARPGHPFLVFANGDGTYHNPSYQVTAPGTYQWVAIYAGDAGNVATSTACGTAGQTTTVLSRQTPADFDGNGHSYRTVFRPDAGSWFEQRYGGDVVVAWGVSGDVPVPADFDGDGKADLAVFRPSTGVWYVRLSGGGTIAEAFGTDGDVPVPRDYDGDGKADIAVFRPSTGAWYVQRSSGGTVATAWGLPGDVAAPADYDADFMADLAVFRPSTGTWYIDASLTGPTSVQWGAPGDSPVPADYDSDGKADPAVWRPSDGTWYVLASRASPFARPWGAMGDRPVVADYDGDGAADLTVYRPSEGTWYTAFSNNGVAATAWGQNGDLAVP